MKSKVLVWSLAWLLLILRAQAEPYGVVLLYHRVSDQGPASTRVTPERFARHLDLIEQNGYRVVPLESLLSGVYQGDELPPKPVAITFDDAYRSVGEVAYPILRSRRMPFSVFVATDVIDAGAESMLTWPQMREMAGDGLATFGAHSLSHAHLESLDMSARRAEIEGSHERVRGQLGNAALAVFAYPFGEYSLGTESIVRDLGVYALTQQSGAVGSASPQTRIPRFPMYMGGDSDERLLTALRSRPMTALDELEQSVVLTEPSSLPASWVFRPNSAAATAESVQCFSASGTPLTASMVEDGLSVVLPTFKPGRNKVNCTAPSGDSGSFYWYSRLWIYADSSGAWLRE